MSAPASGAADAAVDILAHTLWSEAAGRPVRAIEALAVLLATRGGQVAPPAGMATQAAPQDDLALSACRRIAARALAGTLPDPTGGATHWHPADTLPRWAVGQVALAEIGGLVFYRLEP